MNEQEVGSEVTDAVKALGSDRSRWRRVKFGDVVLNSTAVTKDPVADGYERYIVGQNIPEGGDITTWGEVGDGSFGSRIRTRIETGDVICTTRGPKLKVAMATFRALGAHTNFVLRTKDPSVLDPSLVLFLVESEGFQAHLVKHFRGSVNLFVNWSDAAQYEFDLPPLDEQQRIAEVLWAAENDFMCREEAGHRADNLISSALQEFLDDCDARAQDKHPGYQRLRAESVFHDQPRNGLSPSTAPDAVERYSLSIGCVQNGHVVVEGHQKIAKVDPAQATRFPIHADDILIVRGNGNKNLVGLAGRVTHGLADFVYPDLLIRVTFDPSIIRVPFAVLQWNSRRAHDRLLMRAKSSNGIWKVNGQDVRALEMLVPPIQEQDQFLNRVSHLDRGREAAFASCQQSRALRRKLTAHLL